MNDGAVLLGRGTYGVITAKHGSPVCRKIFSKDKALSFMREAYIIKRLSHISGITEIIDLESPNEDDNVLYNSLSKSEDTAVRTHTSHTKIATSPNRPNMHSDLFGVIVMRKYSVTLKQWLRTNPHYNERIRVLTDIVRILAQVHATGIVHADIKLGNVMLNENNEVRIIDWGLSGPCGYARTHLTTKTYRPKQIIQDYCHDIYSLGVLSIELLLGSIMVNDLDYVACRRLVKSTNLDLPLKKILCRMIHPNCLNRPAIFEIARLFHIELTKLSLEVSHELMEIIVIPHQYGVLTMEYPIVFSRFISRHSEMTETIYCILGAIYNSKNPSELFAVMNYSYILSFMATL